MTGNTTAYQTAIKSNDLLWRNGQLVSNIHKPSMCKIVNTSTTSSTKPSLGDNVYWQKNP